MPNSPVAGVRRYRAGTCGAATDAEGAAPFVAACAPAYLRHAPLSLCVRELNRLAAIREVIGGGLCGPVLDVGCGDGFWWRFLDRADCTVYGIDISRREIDEAEKILDEVAVLDVSRSVPFPTVKFRRIIGNCSLEHVPDIDAALRNMRAAADAAAELILFVPTPTWALRGRTQTALMTNVPRLGMAFAGALNGFFQHWHLYHHRVWASILASNGWDVSAVYGLGGDRSEFLFRLFLPPGLVAFAIKKVIGIYPNRVLRFAPAALLDPLVRLVRAALETPVVDAEHPGAYEYMIVAVARS